MSSSRPTPFSGKIDISGFAPKTGADTRTVTPEVIEELSEQAGFHSRTPQPRAAAKPQKSAPKAPSRITGRTVLLNARVGKSAHDRFRAIVEEEQKPYRRGDSLHKVTLGEVVEWALEALEEKRAAQKAKRD